MTTDNDIPQAFNATPHFFYADPIRTTPEGCLVDTRFTAVGYEAGRFSGVIEHVRLSCAVDVVGTAEKPAADQRDGG
jgi:hypothetical protein